MLLLTLLACPPAQQPSPEPLRWPKPHPWKASENPEPQTPSVMPSSDAAEGLAKLVAATAQQVAGSFWK